MNSILYVIAVICIVLVIYDVFTNNKKLSSEMKILWTVLAIVFNVVAAIVYYFIYKR